MTAAGDLIYGGTGGAQNRLGAGASSNVVLHTLNTATGTSPITLSAVFSGSDTANCINGETDFTTTYTLPAGFLTANRVVTRDLGRQGVKFWWDASKSWLQSKAMSKLGVCGGMTLCGALPRVALPGRQTAPKWFRAVPSSCSRSLRQLAGKCRSSLPVGVESCTNDAGVS
jgi:hypothetical protein